MSFILLILLANPVLPLQPPEPGGAIPPAHLGAAPQRVGVIDHEALQAVSARLGACIEATGQSPGPVQLLLDPEGWWAAVDFGQPFRAPVTEVQVCIQRAARTPARLVTAGSTVAISWPDPTKPQPFPPVAPPTPPWMEIDSRWRCSVRASIDARPPTPCVTADGTQILFPEEAWETNKPQLKDPTVLDAVGDLLQAVKGITLVEIANHDAVERQAYGMNLSQRRAEVVRTYLAQKKGIDADRLMARGYGANVPLADHRTPQGRAHNLRTELRILAWR